MNGNTLRPYVGLLYGGINSHISRGWRMVDTDISIRRRPPDITKISRLSIRMVTRDR